MTSNILDSTFVSSLGSRTQDTSKAKVTSGFAFGRVFAPIYTVGFTVTDASSRLFTKVEGFDKFLKFVSGWILGWTIYLSKRGKELPQNIFNLKGRIKIINDTLAGFNIVGRIIEFTKLDKDGKIEIFTKPTAKWLSRIVLTGANVLETVMLYRDLGGNISGIAAKIGRTPVFKVLYNVGMSNVKNILVVTSSLLVLLDIGYRMTKYYILDDKKEKIYWVKEALGFGNDLGKIALIIGSEVLKVAFTYQFAALLIFTNLDAITKILYEDYSKEASDKKKADEKNAAHAKAQALALEARTKKEAIDKAKAALDASEALLISA